MVPKAGSGPDVGNWGENSPAVLMGMEMELIEHSDAEFIFDIVDYKLGNLFTIHKEKGEGIVGFKGQTKNTWAAMP